MSEEDEYEEATPEQKLSIATYFITSSPTGEVDEVAADVAKLVNNGEVMSTSNVNNILKSYNNDQMVWAEHEGKNVLVSAFGQVADDEYLDPNSGTVLKWSHKKRSWLEPTDKQQSLDDNIAKYRVAIQAALDTYVSEHYREGKCVAQVYGNDDGTINICVSGANTNLNNYWSGGWKATYSVNVSSKGEQELKGRVKINVHYFEDGNVQMHNAMEKTKSVAVGSADDTAKEVVAAVKEIESNLQNNLEEMYVNMHRVTFKNMRRFLPKTRQKMPWNSSLHSLADSVSS